MRGGGRWRRRRRHRKKCPKATRKRGSCLAVVTAFSRCRRLLTLSSHVLLFSCLFSSFSTPTPTATCTKRKQRRHLGGQLVFQRFCGESQPGKAAAGAGNRKASNAKSTTTMNTVVIHRRKILKARFEQRDVAPPPRDTIFLAISIGKRFLVSGQAGPLSQPSPHEHQ